jgi:Zn-dependent protease with chaperone function
MPESVDLLERRNRMRIVLLRATLGFGPRRIAAWLQLWAPRDQGVERDRVAVQFTRNPAALIRALEKLDADASQVRHVTRATGPLWLEFPSDVLGSASGASGRLARELLLDERIDHLRELAGVPPREASAGSSG